MRGKRKKLIYAIISIIIILALKYVPDYFETDNSNYENIKNTEPVKSENGTIDESFEGLTVRFLDVGQADATVIHLPNGETMLIDAGTWDSSDKVISYIRRARVTEIDYAVGTHPHSDHIGGLADVLNIFEVEKLYMPNVVNNSKSFENVLDAVEENDIDVYTAKAGVVIYEDDITKVSILGPAGDEYEELNDYSAIVKIEYGETSFLFTGDAEKLAEEEIVSDVKANVLKVGHHGSNSSSSANFLKRVSPEIAVISVGADNGYNHPSKKVLNRLKSVGAKVYRTDLNGDIVIKSDGVNINVEEEQE